MSKRIITDGNKMVLKIVLVSAAPNGVDIFDNNDPIFTNLEIDDFIDEFGNKTMKFEDGEFIKIDPELNSDQQKIKNEKSINKQIRKLYTEHEERLILMKGIQDQTDPDYVKYKDDISAIVPNGEGK